MVVSRSHSFLWEEANDARSKPSEIAKRAAIFTAVGQIGSMCAGLMMTAMHQTMEGKGGLKGWQWVFIIGTRAISKNVARALLIHVVQTVLWESQLVSSDS